MRARLRARRSIPEGVHRVGEVRRRVGRVPRAIHRRLRGRIPSGGIGMRDGAPTRAEVCAAAIADCFAHDGEILANPIGTLPVIGGRLAKATVAPELVMTDGEALLVENILPVGASAPDKVVAGWNPYRSMFDVVWSGRRHVM